MSHGPDDSLSQVPYRAGDEVIVLALNRKGRVDAVVGGRYRVSVGALTTVCRGDEIRPVQREKGSRRAKRPDPPASTGRNDATGTRIRSLDLHGKTVEETEAAVIAFVNDALLDGADTLEIVHGIGTGRVRRAAIAQLRRISAVKAIRPHPTNPGVTIAHL
jgi:DNA mismatch repair protein MutS2